MKYKCNIGLIEMTVGLNEILNMNMGKIKSDE